MPPLAPAGAECLYVSRQACSSTTISLLVWSFSAFVLGAFGAAGIKVGFRGGLPGAGRLREGFEDEAAEEACNFAEGTNEGDATDKVDLAAALTGFDELAAGAEAVPVVFEGSGIIFFDSRREGRESGEEREGTAESA